MSIVILVAACCFNSFSRSLLNVIDRDLFKKHNEQFLHLYFLTSLFPLVLGLCILLCTDELSRLWDQLWNLQCFVFAFAGHLVGLSFSYAFRRLEVSKVVIKAKIPELFLPLLAIVPFLCTGSKPFTLDLKNTLPLLITWVGLIPLFANNTSEWKLFDRAGIYIGLSLFFQMACSLFISARTHSLTNVLSLSVAMLIWRCLFTLPFYYLKSQVPKAESPISLIRQVWLQLGSRAIIALLTQCTFVFCVTEGSPLVIWPILNMTPLISSFMTQLILKEYPKQAEIIALACFCVGSTIPIFFI